MWLKLWHLLHRIGSCRSLCTVMAWPSMKTHSQRRWLALSGEEQVTLRVATFWLEEWQSVCLSQAAEVMDPGERLLLDSSSVRQSASSGLKLPVQGMNLHMR